MNILSALLFGWIATFFSLDDAYRDLVPEPYNQYYYGAWICLGLVAMLFKGRD